MRRRDGSELKQCAIAEGMESLRQDGWRRVAQGKTTIEEVVRVTQTDEVMAETTEEAEPVVASRSGRNTLSAGILLHLIRRAIHELLWRNPWNEKSTCRRQGRSRRFRLRFGRFSD